MKRIASIAGLILFTISIMAIGYALGLNHRTSLYPYSDFITGMVDGSEEISISEQKALHGDRDASSEIFSRVKCDYNEMSAPEKLKCNKTQEYWATIDAENGSTLGASALYQLMSRREDCRSVNRSAFWLKFMIKNSQDKRIWIDEIPSINERLKSCGGGDYVDGLLNL